MNQTERYYRIDQLIHQRTVVPFNDLLEELEISRATLKRDLNYMRERLNAPILFDRDRGGYVFVPGALGPQYVLPGLWFSDSEILALLTMHRMLDELDSGGLLGPHIAPLIARLNALLGTADGSAAEIVKRVRLIAAHNRPVQTAFFEVIGSALIKRQRVDIDYYTRSRDARSRREVSPQRLVHYRNAWYLDAWCHATGALRVFSMDAVEDAHLIDKRAKTVAMTEVDRVLGSGYGIYRGQARHLAVLRFNAEAARWVRAEIWHPEQTGTLHEDGSWDLCLPYSSSEELEMDILRHGENVQVLEPADLRERVARRLGAARALYP